MREREGRDDRAQESLSRGHSHSHSSKHNPFHLIERDLIGGPIIEARRAGTFMVGHLLGNVELPTFRSYSVILVARKEGLPILQASPLGSVRYHPNPVSTPI